MKKMQKLSRGAMKEINGAAGPYDSCTSHSECPSGYACVPLATGGKLRWACVPFND